MNRSHYALFAGPLLAGVLAACPFEPTVAPRGDGTLDGPVDAYVSSCGNGTFDPNEECDDGNTADGDGCSASCTLEEGWTCSGIPSSCHTTCGDGIPAGDEECDDGNREPNDGCGVDCRTETGWSCSGVPSECTPNCGDGLPLGPEECDDRNDRPGDGCGPDCRVEPGWSCSGVPSECTTKCGDGILAGPEECDDGNTTDGDGCTSDCLVEPYFACEPDGTCHCTVYVSNVSTATQDGASWDSNFTSLQQALEAAGQRAPCEVWVAAGTYSAFVSGEGDAFVLPAGVGLIGGFPVGARFRSESRPASHETILTGEGPGGRASHRVLTAEGQGSSFLEGVTVTNPKQQWQTGPCLFVRDRSLTVRRAILQDCHGGRGAGLDAERAELTLDAVLFRRNVSSGEGGAVYLYDGTLAMRHCTAEENEATVHGGALSIRESPVDIVGSTFRNNNVPDGTGGHVYWSASGSETFQVRDCVFLTDASFGRPAYSGGALRLTGWDTNEADIVNAVFWGNEAQYGAALAVEGIQLTVVNATFADNSATGAPQDNAGAVYCTWGCDQLQVVNSILWGNPPREIHTPSYETPLLRYSDIRGLAATGLDDGNIDATPLFRDPGAGDLTLQRGSPCIDAADGDAAPDRDLLGQERVDVPDATDTGTGTPPYADMGAFEFQP